MRRTVLTAAVAVVGAGLLAACSSTTSPTTATATSCTYNGVQGELYSKGVITVATDNPVYDPWFENNTPSNGQGYESAVAYAIAKDLGFKTSQVKWVYEPFNNAYAPGSKKFDFDINEVSYSAQRAQAVTFSDSYYDVTQALVALKNSPIATKHSAADLKNYVYGDQVGTTSLEFINSAIQPTQTPRVYEDLNAVKQALQENQIAALVTDTPTAQYIASSEIPNSTVVAQFPSSGEHFGLVLAKGDPFVGCLNKAIGTLSSNGTLNQLQKKWLGVYTSIPSIEP
jgi:polar amino acid transport system substrate-binding protein